MNGYVFVAGNFIRYMENISYHIAGGKIKKDLLRKVITALLEADEENEALKLEIYNAIGDELENS